MNPTSTPEVLARIRGRCRLCSKPIIAGQDYVAKLERIGWVHAIPCAVGYREAMRENEEAGS